MNNSKVWILLWLVLMACDTSEKNQQPTGLKPSNLPLKQVVRVSAGDLKAVFADNSAYGDHHLARYNGISELYHTSQDSTVFVPAYAGFNLEHIFGGDSLTELFEPRIHPMELYQVSDSEILLYQSATPLSNLESLTKFQMVAPHYIDVTFRFIIHHSSFYQHNYAGLFWASYIHTPVDKKIYFKGSKKDDDSVKWISAYSGEHGERSTHLSKRHTTPVYFAENFNATLASHFSDYGYSDLFYYGRFHNMVLAFMFHSEQEIRFSQSPTGGGALNPAWDFQLIVPEFEVGKEYSFKARVVYKEFAGQKQIEEEYEKWRKVNSDNSNFSR